jgi:Aerotolerance regulator N-terminal
MLPVILYPLALFGLLGIPALMAIYLFRNRFQRQVVSSLMLWLDPREAREGGTRFRRLQTPILLALELLALLLLAFAASEPLLRLSTASRPLVVVLDDSYSMLAGGDDSSRSRAIAALREELERQKPYSIRFILAGERPQALGEPVRSNAQAIESLERWRCRSTTANIDEAVALGAELGGEVALLLVLSDHKPGKEIPEKSRVRWMAFGKPRPNVAFVNAARSLREGLDRYLLEVANLSDVSRSVSLLVEPLEGGPAIHRTTLELPAGETQRLIRTFPANTPTVRAQLSGGELAIDSEVILLPDQDRSVRVETRILDRRLRDPVERAIRASGLEKPKADNPTLIFSDRGDVPDAGSAWVVYLLNEKDAAAYAGPFVLDRASPLTDGLGLKTVIWGAGKTPIDGAPVIMAGNVPLVTDSEVPIGGGLTRHDIRLRIKPDLSTLLESLDWPILISNILSARAQALPGLPRSNIRLGEEITCEFGVVRDRVRLTEPGLAARELTIKDKQVRLRGDEVGLYTLGAGEANYSFAVNALNKDESDLRGCETGTWGDWLDETTLRLDYSGISWLLLLIVLGIATIHLLVMARGRAGRTT